MRENDDVDIISMLSLQVSEVEMLGYMFPNQGELELDDVNAPGQLGEVISGTVPLECLDTRLGFTLRLSLGTSATNDKNDLEMVCRLPHEYPSVAPVVFLRASFLSRGHHRELSDSLQTFIQTHQRGELCIGPCVDWLKENIDKYLDDTPRQSDAKFNNTVTNKIVDTVFSRMWIYSHHIYSKIKRKDILEFTAELNLTGFTLPGKPGMIVVEGYNCHVEEFWHRIRRMQWKRITMKEKEDQEIGDTPIDNLRKFPNFEEKCFEPRPGKSKRGVHMDLGLVYKYLEERKCGHIFSIYFGVDGKLDEDDSDD